MRDLSSLSPLKTKDTLAAVSSETNLGLPHETKPKSNAEIGSVSSSLWTPEVKDTAEKTKNVTSSSGVTSSKKLKDFKRSDIVPKVKQDDNVFSKPEIKFKRKSMRRSMSETNLSNVRKMISTFEIKVTQDTQLRTSKIPTDSFKDAEEKTNMQSQPTSAEKKKERKITMEDMDKSVCGDNIERCDIFTKDNSLEQSTRRSDLLSKQRRTHFPLVEGKNEKKLNQSARLKDSQLENARGSRLWIFPEEAKELSFETDFGTRHFDLAEANLLQKKTDESNDENIGERGSRCRSIAKTNSNNKWKNIERSKNHKSETSGESESSRGPVGQVMRALIVVGFASLVILTRQRT